MYSTRKLKKIRRRVLFHVVAFALLAFAIYFTILRKDDNDKKNASSIESQNTASLQVN
jgi:hypothetical protein